jgi:CelD/BcsL family acetyltransferase involved in cellulose biosynthesis
MLLDAIASEIRFDLFTSVEQLSEIESEWRELWRSDPRATPFQSPDWLLPWARHLTNNQISSVALRSDGGLLGLLPAFTWMNPLFGERELVLLGTGISDYNNVLLTPDADPQLFQQALSSLPDSWTVLNFEQLPADSPLLIGEAEPELQSVCPALDLPDCIDGLTLSSSLRENLHYYRRRAERIGPVSFEQANDQTLHPMLDELIRLSSPRWHRLKRRSVLDDPSIQTFHHDAAQRLLNLDILRLYRMRIRDRTAALAYTFACRGTAYYYLAAYEPDLASISPGTLLIEHVIHAAILEGCRKVDFLRGSEGYKYLWGAKDTHAVRLRRAR